MNLASHIASFKERGFPSDHAEFLALMSVATGVLFQDFPDSFLLFGGATLVFFHQSDRHSADIDLLSRTEEPPTLDAIRESIRNGVTPTAESLGFAPLQFEATEGVKLWTRSRSGEALFSVDLTRFGSVLESQVVEHNVAIDSNEFVKVQSASRDFLLLQKAECFLLRRSVKARDAYDIYLLKSKGAFLDENLTNHLSDTLSNHEIETEDIAKRIEWINEKHCHQELHPLLPSGVFDDLARDGFERLRDALYELYRDWL